LNSLDALKRKQGIIKRVLMTSDGKELMRVLEETFEERRLRGDDPYDTYYNLGQRDLVQYLKQLRDMNDE
jgi:hypothetical protein